MGSSSFLLLLLHSYMLVLANLLYVWVLAYQLGLMEGTIMDRFRIITPDLTQVGIFCQRCLIQTIMIFNRELRFTNGLMY